MKIGEYEQMMSYLTRPAAETRESFAKGTNLTNLEKKQNLYNKALKELPEGYLEDYKNIFLKDRGDGTFSRKSGEEGGFDIIREKYGNEIKQIKTRQGSTKNIDEKIKVFNNAILQNLKKENKIVSGLKDKDAKRTQYVRDAQGRDIKYKAPKGYQAHHMLPLGSRIGMTNRDIAIISKEMNAALSEYDKPMNKLVQDSMKLNFNEEGSLKKLDEINKKLAGYVEKAEKELPKKYKGLIGFNKLTPVLDTFDEKGEQVFGVEKIGTDYKKSIGAKEPEKLLKDTPTKELQRQTANAPKLKASLIPGLEKIGNEIAQGIKNIPDDIKKKKYFTLGLKALGPLGTYIAVDDAYESFKKGKSVAEALEYGLIGTNLIGSAKDLMALSPEEREARSVVKQAEMADQIAQDESMLDTDFETPKVKSDLTDEEAKRKYQLAQERIEAENKANEAKIAKARAISMSGLKDLITGKRFAGQEMPTQYMAAGGRMGFADGPDDPSRRKFMKIAGGIASIPLVGKYLKPAMVAAPKVVEVVKRSADGIPEFLGDLVTKVVTFGKKNFTGNRADEFADQYRLDDYVVTQQGNKTTIKKVDDQGEMGYKEHEMELDMDPETGGVTYNEASVRPDAEGKLKDVEEFIDDFDLEEMKKYTYDE